MNDEKPKENFIEWLEAYAAQLERSLPPPVEKETKL